MILTYGYPADVHWGIDLLNRDVIVSFLIEPFHCFADKHSETTQYKSWYGAVL